MLIRVTESSLDTEEATRAVESPAAGAVNLFFGNVRNTNKGRDVSHLFYDAYPAMAEKEMRAIATEANEQFGLIDTAILHRTGRLEIGETSLLVATSHGHRKEAFTAGLWIVDELKRRVPIWKKEVWVDGEEWIEGPEAFAAEAKPRSLV